MTAAIDSTASSRVPSVAAVFVFVFVFAFGCGRAVPAPAVDPLAAAEEIASPELKTTDGQIATHNFRAELAQAERQHAARPADVLHTRLLVDRLLGRAQFFGRLADYDEAEALAKAALEEAPKSGDAHLLRARTMAALHQFAQANAELDRAAALGAEADAVQHVRVGIWQATGDIDRALEALRAWRRGRPNFTAFASEAGALADRHDFTRAAAVFLQARRNYDDVSPFAVAWLEFQEGHMWESAGRSDRARPLFESALTRLPEYAAAAGHLAHLVAAFGDPQGLERARALLEPLIARTDDPEYAGQLGALYRQMHRSADGARLVRQATAGYQALLARHPEAFYDHAARFFLHVAGDPKRALGLAQKNLALRQTPDARDLLAEAERANATTARLMIEGPVEEGALKAR